MQQVYTLSKAAYDGAVARRTAARQARGLREQIGKIQTQANGPAADALAAFDKQLLAIAGTPAGGGRGRGSGRWRGRPRRRARRRRRRHVERRVERACRGHELAAGGGRAPDDGAVERDCERARCCRPGHGEVERAGEHGVAGAEHEIDGGGTGAAQAVRQKVRDERDT